MNEIYDYLEAGFRVFPLHGIAAGACACGTDDCQAIGKHPAIANWQAAPQWSDEQIEIMLEHTVTTGYGVLCDGFLVIDVDPRNGGTEGLALLKEDFGDIEQEAGFVVETGGGGLHIYFKLDERIALRGKIEKYKGIDFKSSGFVVGAGSLHASGNNYETSKGYPQDAAEPPEALLDMLKKPEQLRTAFEDSVIDVDLNDLREMLTYCQGYDDYEDWIKIGMALHYVTGGDSAGLQLWDDWSKRSDKYTGNDIDFKWHSFGKSDNPRRIGTIIHEAEQNGYRQSVTFKSDIVTAEPACEPCAFDLNRPPGYVGKITDWINSQCRYPRERLAVAAALSAIGNIAGLNYQCREFGVTANNFFFCVAGSATGKEAVQQAQAQLHATAGLAQATVGTIKSEKEIVGNLIANQAAFYLIDEVGILLQKIANAPKSGASYLEGVIGALISIYSKANGNLLIGGDLLRDTQKEIMQKMSALQKSVDENEDKSGRARALLESLTKQLEALRTSGLERPYLSLIGYTTPGTFEQTITHDTATNGFIGRSILAIETETNPKAKKRFKPAPLPESMSLFLKSLYLCGDSEKVRVESSKLIEIPTDAEALDYLDQVLDELHEQAEDAKEIGAGLEAIPRRAFELVLKISLCLAIPEGRRTLEHCQWSYSYIKRDIDQKTNLAAARVAEDHKVGDEALARRIVSILSKDDETTRGTIFNRLRKKFKNDDIEKMLSILCANNRIKLIKRINNKGREVEGYFLV